MSPIDYVITADEQKVLDMLARAAALLKSAQAREVEARKQIGDGLRIEAEAEAAYKAALNQYYKAKYEPDDMLTKGMTERRLAKSYHTKAEATLVIKHGKRVALAGRKMLAEAAQMVRESKKIRREARKLDARIEAGLPVNTLTD